MTIRTRTALAVGAVTLLVIAGTVAGCAASTRAPEPIAASTQDAPSESATASATPLVTPTPTPTSTPTLAAPAPLAAGPDTDPGTGTDPTALPVGDVTSNGRVWRQSYAEDFTRPAALGQVRSVYPEMGYYDGDRDTSKLGIYAPDKVLSVSDGALDFWLHSENGQPLVAAVMPDNYTPHLTGRVSIRYKTTTTDGYKFLGMLWPSSDQWNDGEIDWPETLTLGAHPRPAAAIPGTYARHRMLYDRPAQVYAKTDTTAYHVATTEWDNGIVRFYWDGALVSSTTVAAPTKPMRVTLQGETWIDRGAVPRDASGHVSVDWVSIWD